MSTNHNAIELPTEIWLLIFDDFCQYTNWEHIFDQSTSRRLTYIRQLQILQFVCTRWRVSEEHGGDMMNLFDRQDQILLRPLIYRHAAVEHSDSQAERFVSSLDLEHDCDGSRSRWVQTICLRCPMPSTASFGVLFFQFSALTDIACHAPVSQDDLKTLVSTTSHTLKKLLIYLGDDLPYLLPILNRLTTIQDLSLWCFPYRFAGLQLPSEAPNLSSLQRLDLRAQKIDMNFLMSWFERGSFSELRMLSVDEAIQINIPRLTSFLDIQGSRLTTLSLRGLVARTPIHTLYTRVPRLEHLHLAGGHRINIVHMLDSLPSGVQDITLSGMRQQTSDAQHMPFFEEIYKEVQLMPNPRALNAFKLRRELKCINPTALTWHEELARLHQVNYTVWCESKGNLVELASWIEKLGISLMDEEGMQLREYLARAK